MGFIHYDKPLMPVGESYCFGNLTTRIFTGIIVSGKEVTRGFYKVSLLYACVIIFIST